MYRYIATIMRNCRSEYCTRVRKTVRTYLDTDQFGLSIYDKKTRLHALNNLIQNGLDRSSRYFEIIKPLFHAMAIKKEHTAMENGGQNDNMGTHVRQEDYKALNGKRLSECMKECDVARLILVIENYFGKNEQVRKN